MKRMISVFVIFVLLSSLMFAQDKLEKMPQIKGGIMELAKNIKYPKISKDEGIEGTVFVKAVIDEKGNVSSAEIEKGVDHLLNAAALKAVKMTKFEPGVKNGENVKAEIVIPIKFKLDEKKKES